MVSKEKCQVFQVHALCKNVFVIVIAIELNELLSFFQRNQVFQMVDCCNFFEMKSTSGSRSEKKWEGTISNEKKWVNRKVAKNKSVNRRKCKVRNAKESQ